MINLKGKKIKYFVKSVYGIDRFYLNDPREARNLQRLTKNETMSPEHMKAPPAKRTKGTKPAPHMVRHTKAPAKAKRAAASFTEKAGVAQDIGPWKPTDRKATKPKVSYKKPKKTPWGMKKGGSVDTQWGGYDFKDGGRIPGIRPTRKGT